MLLLSFMLTAQYASAQQKGPWVKIGEKVVSVNSENDVIRSVHKGFFSKIKLQAKNYPIEVRKITVYFTNGSSKTMRVRTNIKAGGDSRIINLPGSRRMIREVVVQHKVKVPKTYRPPVRPGHRPGHRPGSNPSYRPPVASISVWAHR